MVWDGRRVPFTLVGGYLGAGKTTIVNHLLRHAGGRRLVVLVNDVGAVNVDAALIADHDGETLTLTNGCVCCAIADDFAQVLERVRGLAVAPDHVVMELSGVGEPARLAPWANTAGFRLDGIVVAADAEQVVTLAGRRYIGDTIREQLRAADVVLLTKLDLADDGGALARRFIGEHSTAPVVDVDQGRVDVDVVLGVARDLPLPEIIARAAAPGSRVAVVDVGVVTFTGLERFVDDLPASVIRAKGLVRCTDRAHPVEVHVVGRRRSLTERPDRPVERAVMSIVVIDAPR